MTINYIEKGIGLHHAISAAGHRLGQVDGVWETDYIDAVQAIIDGYTLSDAKAEKSRLVLAHAKALRDGIVASISVGEMATWPIKRAEAAAYAADNTSPCPMLSAEAAARGVTLPALIAKVSSNSARFSMAEAAIGGADGKHRDAIAALSTFEEVATYNFSTGWPAV